MASIDNYGLKALVTAMRFCAVPGCSCSSDIVRIREEVNNILDSSHQLDASAFNDIWFNLDEDPIADRPETSTGGNKQRDDGNFDRVVQEAFKAFRDQEREITLNAPEGSSAGPHVCSRNDDTPDEKFWPGAAQLRHHLQFLFVLKGIKPCLLFWEYGEENERLFSSVVIDCLVPIMDRLDLWSYGFRITFQSGHWVFYDARSPKMPLINKIYLTHFSAKEMDPVTYPRPNGGGVPEYESAEALGYPVPYEDFPSGDFISIRDSTELDVLISRGWPHEQACCVKGMEFICPGGDESVWKNILDFYRRCQEAAESVGTKLTLDTGKHDEMTEWLEENPGMLDGITLHGRHLDELDEPVEAPAEQPLLNEALKIVDEMIRDGLDLDNMDFEDTVKEALEKLSLKGLGMDTGSQEQDENVGGSDDRASPQA